MKAMAFTFLIHFQHGPSARVKSYGLLNTMKPGDTVFSLVARGPEENSAWGTAGIKALT